MACYSATTSPGEVSYSHLAAGAVLLSFDVSVCSPELSLPGALWSGELNSPPASRTLLFPSVTVLLFPLKSMAWQLCERGENLILQGITNHRHIKCALISKGTERQGPRRSLARSLSLCLSLRISILLPETCRGHSWIVQQAVSTSLGKETISAEVSTRKPAGGPVPSAHRPLPQTPLRSGLQPFLCLFLPLRPRCLPWDVFLSFNIVKPNVFQAGKSHSQVHAQEGVRNQDFIGTFL